MTDVGQNWSDEGAEGMQRTLSVDTATMILELEGNLQRDAVCQSICKDMMFMGQCDSSDIYYDAASPIERSPVVVVYRGEEQVETSKTNSTAITPGSRKRSIRHFRRSRSEQSSKSTRIQGGPENVDVVFMLEDTQQCFIEVCSSPHDKVDDLCQEQGWPRS
jgi:hypothetical protein